MLSTRKWNFDFYGKLPTSCIIWAVAVPVQTVVLLHLVIQVIMAGVYIKCIRIMSCLWRNVVVRFNTILYAYQIFGIVLI